MKFEGHFRERHRSARGNLEPQWQRAELRVPIADVRGIRRVSALRFGEGELAFGPGTAGVGGVAAISAAAPIDPRRSRSRFLRVRADARGHGTLRECCRSRAKPICTPRAHGPIPASTARSCRRRGASTRAVFEAEWQVLDLNRTLPQRWRESDDAQTIGDALAGAAFGITLTQPAGSYQQNVRAGKYGVLFIALTFVAFFLFEVLRGLRVHPVQYLLVGLALATPLWCCSRYRSRSASRSRTRSPRARSSRWSRAMRAWCSRSLDAGVVLGAARAHLRAALWPRRQRGLRAAHGFARAARRDCGAHVSRAPRGLVRARNAALIESVSRRTATAGSSRIVEHDARREAPAAQHAADAVAQHHAMPAARAPWCGRQCVAMIAASPIRSGTTRAADCARGRCSTSTSSPPSKSRPGSLSRTTTCSRKHLVAVEILMQAVVAAFVVAQQ